MGDGQIRLYPGRRGYSQLTRGRLSEQPMALTGEVASPSRSPLALTPSHLPALVLHRDGYAAHQLPAVNP